MNEDASFLSPEEMARAERIAYLVAAFIREDLTAAETAELDDWVGSSNENLMLLEELTDEKNLASMLERIVEVNTLRALERVQRKIALREERKRPVIRRLLPYMVAACVVGVIATVVYIVRKPVHDINVVKPVISDVLPGGNRATITLSNGSIINLDNIKNGQVALQGNSKIIKTDSGKLAYELTANSQQPEQNQYNTLTTPRGGQYQLTLPDGTHVWLNAQSSIKYPVAFSEAERSVELKGEGYFEVSKDPSKPFIVKVGEAAVRVLGTHFNINAYDDETTVKTTLLEGSVRISEGGNEALLKPGQQASLEKDGKIDFIREVNADDVVAWKTGMFSFHREDIGSIMRQVSRWYDVDIKYEGELKNHLNATIERNVQVSRLLKLLEGTGDVHFIIQDKTIIVKP